jgi:hypothetical protein
LSTLERAILDRLYRLSPYLLIASMGILTVRGSTSDRKPCNDDIHLS